MPLLPEWHFEPAALSPPREAANFGKVFLPRLLHIFGTLSSHRVPFRFRALYFSMRKAPFRND
jgi:hypothetical protein